MPIPPRASEDLPGLDDKVKRPESLAMQAFCRRYREATEETFRPAPRDRSALNTALKNHGAPAVDRAMLRYFREAHHIGAKFPVLHLVGMVNGLKVRE